MQVCAAEAALSRVEVVGLDRESCPTGLHSGEDGRASLLQIASRSVIVLLDLRALNGAADELIASLLCDPKILKLGMGWGQDLETLSADYPASDCYRCCSNLLEVTDLFSLVESNVQQPVGLKRMSCYCLHATLNKKQQTSNWNRRPLTPEQVDYAALDAYVLIMIYDALRAQASEAFDLNELISNISNEPPTGAIAEA